jgi:hypothetical protein
MKGNKRDLREIGLLPPSFPRDPVLPRGPPRSSSPPPFPPPSQRTPQPRPISAPRPRGPTRAQAAAWPSARPSPPPPRAFPTSACPAKPTSSASPARLSSPHSPPSVIARPTTPFALRAPPWSWPSAHALVEPAACLRPGATGHTGQVRLPPPTSSHDACSHDFCRKNHRTPLLPCRLVSSSFSLPPLRSWCSAQTSPVPHPFARNLA